MKGERRAREGRGGREEGREGKKEGGKEGGREGGERGRGAEGGRKRETIRRKGESRLEIVPTILRQATSSVQAITVLADNTLQQTFLHCSNNERNSQVNLSSTGSHIADIHIADIHKVGELA